MNKQPYFAIWLLLMLLNEPTVVFAQTSPVKDSARHLVTDNGIEFGLWGGNNDNKPAPILFVLASSIDETLGVEYFRQCGNRLAREYGWLCVSLDLPYHGKQKTVKDSAGLVGWANAVRMKEDFITSNNQRMKAILEYLIRNGFADESNIELAKKIKDKLLAINCTNQVELNVMWEPKGHTTPKGAVDRLVTWFLDRSQKK